MLSKVFARTSYADSCSFFYFTEDSDDIDPDAVKASLSELLQNLRESERKKEESLVKVDSLQNAVGHLEEERAELDGKLRAVHQEMNQLRDQKRLLEDRLNSAETALTLQVRNGRYLLLFFVTVRYFRKAWSMIRSLGVCLLLLA